MLFLPTIVKVAIAVYKTAVPAPIAKGGTNPAEFVMIAAVIRVNTAEIALIAG